MPFETREVTQFLVPELRSAISAGTYNADLIACLPSAVQTGDRVLVLGAGAGIVSTLIAREHSVDRVIVLEPDTRIAGYLQSVHELNGVSWIETVNAVPTNGEFGRVPFFARRDLRRSSLAPDDGDWDTVMRVPTMNLELVLSDARTDLLVCDMSASMLAVLEDADLACVDRILVSVDGDGQGFLSENQTAEYLRLLGFSARVHGTAVLFDRTKNCGESREVH